MRAPGPCPATSASVRDDVGAAVRALDAVGARERGAGKLSTTTDASGRDSNSAPAPRGEAFALDLRAWTFDATTQAVRALGACARDASVDLAVPFRDAYERYCAMEKSVKAPRGAAWRVHRCGGWRFDLRALYESVKKRGGYDAIDGNAGWREVAESIGAHGRGCRAGHAARCAHRAWLREYERRARDEEETSRAREYVANAASLAPEDAEIIDALVGLEFGASTTPPRRDAVENVRKFCHIYSRLATRDLRFEGDSTRDATRRATRSRPRVDRLTFTDASPSRSIRQGLDHIARQLGDAHDQGDADCDVCGASGDEDAMILCDGCDRGSHMYCLTPKMTEVPSGEWFCAHCEEIEREVELLSEDRGVPFTLAQFNDSCIEFDTAFFGEDAKRVGISMQVIDECFWRMVEDASSADDVCEVKCGTEIDTTKHGSGFPRRGETLRVKIEGVGADDIQELAESKWNLNNVARASGEHPSVLSFLREDLPGVTTPVLEVGSTFSSTTWRRENHDLYRITYNHWGAPKTWYCVPASAADKFEECFKNVMPDVYEAHVNNLGRVFTMLSPNFLMNAGVPVNKLEQYPGEYVITFPGAYYATFNCGLNCTESVNYAPTDWLASGSLSAQRNRLHATPSLFSHEELVCRSADEPSEQSARHLWPEIARIYTEEAQARNDLFASGVSQSAQIIEPEEDKSNGVRKTRSTSADTSSAPRDSCVVCRQILYLSGVSCSCDDARKACSQHAAELCECAASNKTMFYRRTLADLETLVAKSEKLIPAKELAALKSENAGLGQVATNKGQLKKAQAWVKRVGEELVKPPLPPLQKLKSLLVGGEEFVWGGSDMKSAREAYARVMNAIAWQTSLVALKQRLGSGSNAEAANDDIGAPRLSLDRLKELLDNPPVPMPKSETQPLRDLLAAGKKLEERIKAALAEEPNPAPRACSSLQTEANKFGVEVPSYNELKDVIARAGSWSTKVRTALPGRRQLPPRDELANAREIEALYEEASGLPVQQSELLTLRKALEELNFWRAKSESLFAAKVDFEDANALLKEGMSLSVKLDAVDELGDQIEAVKVWAGRARASDYPQARVSDLRLLLREGENFSVRVDEVEWLKNRITVRELAEKLKEMVANKQHPLADVEEAVKQGNEFLDSEDKEVAPDEEALLTQCEAHIKAAKKWNERAAVMLKAVGSKDQPSLEDAATLIRDGNMIPIALDGFDVLSEAVNMAKSWLERAQPCLKGKQLTRRGASNPIPPLSEAHELMKESKDLKLYVKEVGGLQERVEAAEEWDVDAQDAIKRWREDGAEVTLNELDVSHEDFGLELPAIKMVRIRLNSLKWEERVAKVIAPKAKLIADTVLDELRAQIDELQDLKEDLVAEIIQRHTIVDEWRKKADLLLDPPPLEDGRLAPSASPDEIDALIAEGKALPANVSKVEDLETSLADHAVWVETVRKCLNSVAEGRPRPKIDELYDLLAEVEDLTFKCSERQALTNACNAATAWTDKLGSLLWVHDQGELRTDKTLTEKLMIVLESIKAGIEDITGTGEPPETEEGQFCLCRQAGGVQMVGCDDCGDWYHLKCINVTPTMAKTMHNYICPPCMAKSGKANQLSLETYRSVHRTNRPNVMLLRELLGEAQRFSGEVPEETILNQVINTHDAWRLEVRKVLHRKSVKEAHENAIKQAAKIAQEAATRESEERTRRATEAVLSATAENPNPQASLTPLQQVMLMGQAVTFAATQRTHALSVSPCSAEISEVVTKQLSQLQQLAMQLAMCQAQIHMAPVRSRPHILHVLMMQSQHSKMTKDHEQELADVGASDWLMQATLRLSGIIPSVVPGENASGDANVSAEQSMHANEQAQAMMAQQLAQQMVQPTLPTGDMGVPGMMPDMGLAMGVARNDNVDPAIQVYAGMKGALAMELEPVEETLALMREVCGPAWREQAIRLMTGPPFPRLLKLHELKESAMAAGLRPGTGIDPLADRAHALEVAGQIWLERAAAVVQDKSIPIEAAQMLLQEGRSLPLYLKEELEELGERCELYCVCRSAYDALRPMICCDRCDGWFHYECIGMQPPAPGEEDENAENVKFACPECCAAQGIPYVPFRPAPKDVEPVIVEAAPPAPEPPAPVPEQTGQGQVVVKQERPDNKKKRKPAAAEPANKPSTSRSRRRK